MRKVASFGIVVVIVLVLISFFSFNTSFGKSSLPSEDAIKQQANKKMKTVRNLMNSQPNPQINFSMDRYLLSERLVRFNDPAKMSYLYVCFVDGTWVQFTILGKVASTGKRLTPPVKNYKIDRGDYMGTELGPAPDEMAVYGNSSGSAKVGMTTLGSLIEYGGFTGYIYSEVPLIFKNMTTQMVEIEISVTPKEKELLNKKLNDLRKESNK